MDDDSLWNRIEIAKQFNWNIGIEIPAIPGYEKKTMNLIDYIADKVSFINLNELELSDTGTKHYTLPLKGFKTKDNITIFIPKFHDDILPECIQKAIAVLDAMAQSSIIPAKSLNKKDIKIDSMEIAANKKAKAEMEIKYIEETNTCAQALKIIYESSPAYDYFNCIYRYPNYKQFFINVLITCGNDSLKAVFRNGVIKFFTDFYF